MRRIVWILVIVGSLVAVGLRVLGASPNISFPAAVTLRNPSALFQAAGTKSLRSVRFMAPPVMDGSLNEWPSGEGVVLNRDTAYAFSGRVDSTADCSAVIRSGWTQNTLYFAIQVSDDVIVTDSSDVWRDDGVELGLDGARDLQPWGVDDHQYTIVADGRVADRAVLTQDITAAVTVRSGGFDIEVAIPMAKLVPGIPISGTVLGFTWAIHDDDDGGNWDAYLIWDGTNTSSMPDEFGSLALTERPEDRIAALEAKVTELEAKVQELLVILAEFEQVTPP